MFYVSQMVRETLVNDGSLVYRRPYEQNRLQVPLPEELTNSMRSMPSTPATSNLVNERFRNMVYHRGLVERGKKQPRQRAWRKFVDK